MIKNKIFSSFKSVFPQFCTLKMQMKLICQTKYFYLKKIRFFRSVSWLVYWVTYSNMIAAHFVEKEDKNHTYEQEVIQ